MSGVVCSLYGVQCLLVHGWRLQCSRPPWMLAVRSALSFDGDALQSIQYRVLCLSKYMLRLQRLMYRQAEAQLLLAGHLVFRMRTSSPHKLVATCGASIAGVLVVCGAGGCSGAGAGVVPEDCQGAADSGQVLRPGLHRHCPAQVMPSCALRHPVHHLTRPCPPLAGVACLQLVI